MAAFAAQAPSSLRFLQPAVAPLVISSAGLPLGAWLCALATHVPYALTAQLTVPFSGVPPPLGLMAELPVLPPTRELYLYSRADRLVSASDIESHARRREQRGALVTLCELESSPHCEHFKRHPSEYAAAVGTFIERVSSSPFPNDLCTGKVWS